MCNGKLLTPEEYLAYAYKFAEHRIRLEKLADAINRDVAASFPNCLERQLRRDDLHRAAAHMLDQAAYLDAYSHALADLARILQDAATFTDPVTELR